MKKNAFFGLYALALTFVGAGCAQAPRGTQPVVATTIVPLTSMAQNVMHGVADVQSVLPKGAEPHDVTLSTRELQIMQNADTFITLGLTLDDWIATGISATESKSPVIVASKYLNMSADLTNPHVWLSPKRMIVMTNGVSNELQKQFPDASSVITANTITYRAKLQQLDTEYSALRALPHRDIVTLHDAFGYLAEDYGLNIVGVVKELPEDNPSPEDIARIVTVLKEHPQAALFGESDINPTILESVARDTGRKIYTLDPLEVGEPQPDTYVTVMTKNLATLKQALGVR